MLPIVPKQFSDRFSNLFKKAGVPAGYPPQAFLDMLDSVPKRTSVEDNVATVIIEMLHYVIRCKSNASVALSSQNELVPIAELLFVDNPRLEVPVWYYYQRKEKH